MFALVEGALFAVAQLLGGRALDFTTAHRATYCRAFQSVFRPGRANPEFIRMSTASLSSTFSKFPAVHYLSFLLGVDF